MSESGNGEVSQEALMEQAQKDLYNRQREEDTSGDHSAISDSKRLQTGVIMKGMTAVFDEKEYRQALLLSDFLDDTEADRVSAAISEANRYGLSLIPILDWCAARCAVNKHGHGKSRIIESLEGLTHLNFTTQTDNTRKRQQASGAQNTQEG